MCRFCEDVPPHEHEQWGYDYQQQCFNTSKEAEYPIKMCEQYADIPQQLHPAAPRPEGSKRKLPFSQPRGRSNPQIVSEFLSVATLKLQSVPPLNDKKQLIHDIQNVPAGSREASKTSQFHSQPQHQCSQCSLKSLQVAVN